uniref:Integrase catalytic domain-containing protein n=1 Tax=Chenopodium quinoa TaxID=63459 RepID=A0A803LV14_CHEQI
MEVPTTFGGEDAAEMVTELRRNFVSGKTRSYEWRVTQLKSIVKFVEERYLKMGDSPDDNKKLISIEQMEQMFQMFQKLNKNPINPESGNAQSVRISEKLNYTNYTKWCKLMQIAIGGRGRLDHITGNPLTSDNPEYAQWAQRDSIVFSWIIENIDGDLVNQFLDYKTSRDLWKGIETLLSSGRDELQIYDLNLKAASIKQGRDTIEMYFSKLNILWKEIDRRMPNPMKCSEDITLFNSFIQRQRLYQFLAGIDNSLDKEKRDLLYLDPLPTLDAAYATIRREIARRGIMTGDSSSGQSPSEIGSGLVAQNRSEKSSRLEDKTMLKCSHCGGTKHTKSGCFKLIGYPEWWDELRQRKAAAKATGNRTGGKANFVASEREINGDDGSSPTTKNTPGKSTGTGINLIANFHGEAMKEKGKVTEEDERKLRRDGLLGGTERGGLYFLDEATQHGNALLAHGSPEYQLWMWHRRLGHPSVGYLKRLFPSFKNIDVTLDCESCALAKSHKHTYSPSLTHAIKPFMLIHSDVWGPAPEFAIHNFSYFVLFVDDCTRMSWVYFLKHKSEVFDVFVKYYNMIRTQFNAKPQILRSDNGGEYINLDMEQYIADQGLVHQTSCRDTPQQNGVAERKNRTLLEITRAIMIESGVPVFLWPEAIATSTYLTNRLPTKTLDYETPLDTLSSHTTIPSSHSLPPRVFGCVVYVHLPKIYRNKLEPRAIKCVFIGYGVHQKGYRCYDPTTRKIHTTLDCEFFEKSYYYTQPGPQGETSSDDLSWLTYPEVMDLEDPTTQVDSTTDVASPEVTVPSSPLQSTPDSPTEHPTEDVVISSEVNTENSDLCDLPITDPVVPSENCPNRYELPPRRTRGVPPKRYDPEYEDSRSRYPIGKISNENLASNAIAFTASLYSTEIPKTVEEALASKDWRKAMEDEYLALEKNETWEK